VPQIVPFPDNRRPANTPSVGEGDEPDPFDGASAQDLAWAFTLAAELYLADGKLDLAMVASQLALQAAARCCEECLAWAMSVRSNALTRIRRPVPAARRPLGP